MADRAQCCSNPPALSASSGLGCVVDDLGGLKAYTAGSPDSKAAVVFISDIFGYEAPKLRKLADKTAASGFFAVVPDFLYGDPYSSSGDRTLAEWDLEHPPDKPYDDAKCIIEALKNKGISAVGAVGFCWGGKGVALLAKTDYIKAAVLMHPNFVTVDDIKDIIQPITILGAEIDQFTPPALVKHYEEILSLKPEVDSYVKIFPGTEHGWTCRYDENDEEQVKNAEEAHGIMLAWFTKYVKQRTFIPEGLVGSHVY